MNTQVAIAGGGASLDSAKSSRLSVAGAVAIEVHEHSLARAGVTIDRW
jgi:hypothetical protein